MTKSKLSLIIAITFSAILLVSVVVLAILQTNTKPNLPNPDTIKIYNKELSASKTYEKGSDEYKHILKLYNAMFEKTFLSQIADNQTLSGKLSEDINKAPWSDGIKQTGLFIEFEFSTTKKFIIYRDGNARRVDVKSIFIELTGENSVKGTSIYYTLQAETGTDKNEKTEPCYPIIAEANTSNLHTYVKSLL